MIVAEKVERERWYRQRYEQNKNIAPHKKVQPLKKGRLILAVTLIAIIAILILSRYSAITEAQYRISKMKAEIKEINAQNERLQVEIANLNSVARIEDIAKNKLNMKEPESEQVIYISTK